MPDTVIASLPKFELLGYYEPWVDATWENAVLSRFADAVVSFLDNCEDSEDSDNEQVDASCGQRLIQRLSELAEFDGETLRDIQERADDRRPVLPVMLEQDPRVVEYVDQYDYGTPFNTGATSFYFCRAAQLDGLHRMLTTITARIAESSRE